MGLIEALEFRRMLSASAIAAPSMLAEPQGSLAGSSATPQGFTPSQIKGAYSINSVEFGSTSGDGTGQTVAIISAYDDPQLVDSTDPNFDTSDLHLFDEYFGLPDPPSFTKVDQTGGTDYPADDEPSWANESAMDVEWVHAMAPKANIILVEADSTNLTDLVGGAVNYARSVAGVSVISMTFAADEDPNEDYYDQFFSTPSGHNGVTFVVGSGDDGDVPEYPAASPDVLSIGATTLTLNGSGGYGSESAYDDSGGGISQYETKPEYQYDVTTPSNAFRTIPDVAFNGDVNTGVDVYDSFDGGSSTPWYKVGGTSFAAPAWAGLIAIADQGRALAGLGTLDGPTQTLPRLYELNESDFNDITTGSNGQSATVGYDLVTGRGTPKANILLPDLAGGASVSGTIYNDVNENGALDSGEPTLSGWTVFVDFNGTGVETANDITAVSDSNGNYTFTDLPGGTFKIVEAAQSGWTETAPVDGFSVTLGYGQAVTGQNIGNELDGSISGYMFNDVSGDGVRQIGDTALSGWEAYLDLNNDGVYDGSDVEIATGSNGAFSFDNLVPGTYEVRQVTQTGWQETVPASSLYTIAVQPGDGVTGVVFASTQPVATPGEIDTIAAEPPKSPAAGVPPKPTLPAAGVFSDAPGVESTSEDGWLNNSWSDWLSRQKTNASDLI